MNQEKCINICIVHYNTPYVTECLCKSINKFTHNSNIYIFDNSDRFSFTYRQENITYFDNTKGQLIDFDKWLNSIEHLNSCNNWVSAKHCYSILKCIELIDEPFILLDSDVLLKRDVSDIVDCNAISSCSIEKISGRKDRAVPFICFINTNLCKQNKINYFDKNRMVHVSNDKVWYDTGASFLEDILKLNYKINYINHNEYIVHYGSASWNNTWFKLRLPVEDWVQSYKYLFMNENIKEHISVVIPCHNSESFIDGIISDLNNLTFKDFDVIFVDDNSDKLLECELKNMIIQFPFKVVRTNKGTAGGSRNAGIPYITGEYCYFVDSDDRISWNFLEYSIKTLNKFPKSLPLARKKCVNIKDYINIKNSIYRAKKRHFNSIVLLGRTIFKSEVVQDNNLRFTELNHWEDFIFISEYLYLANVDSIIKHSAIFYRVFREDSITHDNSRFAPSIKIFEKIILDWERRKFPQVLINKFKDEINSTKQIIELLNIK